MSDQILTFDQLLAAAEAEAAAEAAKAPDDTFTIAGIGRVRVRALNRAEALRVSSTPDVVQREAVILSLGICEPCMTVGQVLTLMNASRSMVLEDVSREIGRRSGLLEDQPAAAYKSDGGDGATGV